MGIVVGGFSKIFIGEIVEKGNIYKYENIFIKILLLIKFNINK